MRSKHILFLFLALCIAIISACKKDEIKLPQKYEWKCGYENTLDSTEIYKKLEGTWDWAFISCIELSGLSNGLSFKGLTVTFAPDHSLTARHKGMLMQNSKYRLEKELDGSYTLFTEPMVLQLYGRIIFCEDKVLFYDSYVDGCDNYFEKK